MTRCPKTGRFNRFDLTDDGTMDTVVACSECGVELRYNYDPDAAYPAGSSAGYIAFTEECRKDAAEDHEDDDMA